MRFLPLLLLLLSRPLLADPDWITELRNTVNCRISHMAMAMAGNSGMGVENAIHRMRNSIEVVEELGRSPNGLTFNLPLGTKLNGRPLVAVAIYPERTFIKRGSHPEFDDLDNFIGQNRDLLYDSKNSVGIWVNQREGLVEYDVVYTVPNSTPPETLQKIGKKFNQKAVFDLGRQQVIPIPGATGQTPYGLGPVLSRQRELEVEFNFR